MNYIAVVEDSAQDRAVLDSYLEKYQQEKNCHFQITHFSDGDEIALGYKGGYDLILMDIEMTFLDGILRRVGDEDDKHLRVGAADLLGC